MSRMLTLACLLSVSPPFTIIMLYATNPSCVTQRTKHLEGDENMSNRGRLTRRSLHGFHATTISEIRTHEMLRYTSACLSVIEE